LLAVKHIKADAVPSPSTYQNILSLWAMILPLGQGVTPEQFMNVILTPRGYSRPISNFAHRGTTPLTRRNKDRRPGTNITEAIRVNRPTGEVNYD
jgi:hypothetical protein